MKQLLIVPIVFGVLIWMMTADGTQSPSDFISKLDIGVHEEFTTKSLLPSPPNNRYN